MTTASEAETEKHPLPRSFWWTAACALAVMLAAGWPALFPVLLAAALAGAAMLLLNTRSGLYVLAFAIAPLGIIQKEIAGVTINLPEALILFLFLKELGRFLLRGEKPAPLPWLPIALYLGAALLACATGLGNGHPARAVFQDARQFTEYLTLYFLVAHRVTTPRQAAAILLAFVLGIALLALHGIAQRYGGFGIPGTQLISDLVYHGAVRSGSFYGATPLGALMVLALGPALGLLLYAPNFALKAGLGITVALFVTAAVFTKTRASWLAILLLLAVMFLLLPKSPKQIAAAAIAALVFAAALGPEVADRMSTLSFGKAERSLRMRVQYYATAGHIAQAHPWMGLGWGGYYSQGDILINGRYVPRTPNERPVGSPKQATVHSAYLQLLVKTGLLGLGAFLLILLGGARRVLPACLGAARTAPHFPLLAGTVASLAAYLAHAGLENFFQWPVMAQAFWLLMGTATALTIAPKKMPSNGCQPHA